MRYMPRTQNLLRFVEIWPQEIEGKKFMARQYLYMALCIYNAIGITIYPLATIKDRKIPIEHKLDNLLRTTCIVVFTYNYICTFYLREKIANIFKQLEDFSEFGEPPKVELLSKIMDFISIGQLIYCVIIGLYCAFFPAITMGGCFKNNEINNFTIMCGFETSMRYPYDIDANWLYYLHLGIEIFCGSTIIARGVIFFGIVLGNHELIVLMFNHLISKFENVYCDDDFLNQKERLRNCIMYHIRILNLSKELANCFAILTMPCIITYNVIIGSSLLAVLTVHTHFSFMSITGWTVSLFMACVSGERIITASTSVGDAAYNLKWYTDVRLRKEIQLIILRSQKPVRLQCGQLGELSYVTFKKIMQGAYTLATMRSGAGR